MVDDGSATADADGDADQHPCRLAGEDDPTGDDDSTGVRRPDTPSVRADALRITSRDQLRAFDHPLRHRIIGRLGQEPATVSMLADELGRPPGTIGHHTKVLEQAGLVEVVRTRDVNGITERWLGRSARTFEFPRDVESGTKVEWLLTQFARAREVTDRDGGSPHLLTVRIARIPSARAEEWAERLLALAEEFAAEPVGGDTTHTLILGITAGTGIGDE